MIREGNGREVPPWIGIRKDWRARGGHPSRHLIGLTPAELRTHALLVGATGSGKTNCLLHLLAQDLMRGHSVAVLDLRGDLVESALKMCDGRVAPGKVALFDLRDGDRPLGFDPLHGAGEPYFRALAVLDALEGEADSWGVQLAETLRHALMLLAECGERIVRIGDLFHDGAFREGCVRKAHGTPSADFWQRFGELSPDKRASLAAPALNKVSLLLATRTLREILGHPAPLDLAAQVDSPGSVTLVSLAADETHGAGRMFGNIFLSALCREAFARVRVPEARRNPVRVYVDEFQNFLRPDFETVLAEGRRFGLSAVLAHQSLVQLTPKLRSMVLNNAGVKFAFRCGREDSAALSKDITGDPDAYDLNAFKTGECLLWARGHGQAVIEVNEPIPAAVRPGYPSAYVAAVKASRPAPLPVQAKPDRTVPLEAARIIPPEPKPEPAPSYRPRKPKSTEPQRATAPAADLEDWLCG